MPSPDNPAVTRMRNDCADRPSQPSVAGSRHPTIDDHPRYLTSPPRGPSIMSSHRALRVAEAIREVVSSSILFEVSDPRVTGVTVLRAEVTGDLRNASVYVSIMGTEAEQNLAMKGLQSA